MRPSDETVLSLAHKCQGYAARPQTGSRATDSSGPVYCEKDEGVGALSLCIERGVIRVPSQPFTAVALADGVLAHCQLADSVVGEPVNGIGDWPGGKNIRAFIADTLDCERHLFAGFQHEHQRFAGLKTVPRTLPSPP